MTTAELRRVLTVAGTPRLELYVCESTRRPGKPSLRLRDGEEFAGSIRDALADAGFEVGDRVVLVLVSRAATRKAGT